MMVEMDGGRQQRRMMGDRRDGWWETVGIDDGRQQRWMMADSRDG